MAGSRPPDYNVSALDKKTDQKGQIGVAWKNDDGTISVRLNFCIVLNTMSQDLVITLFKNEYKKGKAVTASNAAPPYSDGGKIPF